MIESVVRDLGHHVEEAINGSDALQRIHAVAPDLVVTDLEMPVMDGFELIRRIRALDDKTREVPIVVLSSRGTEEDKVHAADLGADAYLVKRDFSEATLAATLSRLLGTQRPGSPV